MADKLSWTDLRRSLAQRAGVSEKEANAFLNSLNAQIVEALKTDKQLKLNGLGTFKLQAVAPRKSVNVTTGAEIVIEGYNKIVFAPEAGVKELVEKVEVRGETTNVVRSETDNDVVQAPIDPLKKLGEQAEEIVGLLNELGQSPVKEDKGERLEAKGERLEAKEEKPFIPEPPKETPPVEPEPEKDKETKPKKEPKKYHFFRDVLICVVILLLILLGGYFFLRHSLSEWITEWANPRPMTTDTVVVTKPAEPVVAVAPEEPIVSEEPVEEPVEPVKEQVVTKEPKTTKGSSSTLVPKIQPSPEYKDLITVEPMHEASRLTWMAKRYYGNKAYWPYLYDANKDHIKDPSAIKVGTPIRVPKLTPEQLDTTSVGYREVRERAERAIQ